MTRFLVRYTSDIGPVIPTNVNTQFVVNDQTVETPEESDLLPPTFVNHAQDIIINCSIAFTPRYIQFFYLPTIEHYFLLPNPFTNNQPEFNQMISEIEANPLILRYKIIGERMRSIPLQRYLLNY